MNVVVTDNGRITAAEDTVSNSAYDATGLFCGAMKAQGYHIESIMDALVDVASDLGEEINCTNTSSNENEPENLCCCGEPDCEESDFHESVNDSHAPSYKIQRMLSIFDECLALADKKSHDYAGEVDPFSNLRDFGWKGIVTRIGDKYHRLKNFCQQGELKVSDESVRDTLRDLVNYGTLALILFDDEAAAKCPPLYVIPEGDAVSPADIASFFQGFNGGSEDGCNTCGDKGPCGHSC